MTKSFINKIKLGSCDIVIGTHRLLQNDLKFKSLGLLIVDEEHKFGVEQKEKFKYDLYYIKNRNTLLDLGVITKTIKLIFTK